MKTSHILLLQIISSLLSIIRSQLSVYSPNVLKVQFKEHTNSDIPYSIGNFGRIPYGKTLVGPAVLASPPDACMPLKAIEQSDIQQSPIVIVLRGNCTFVTKVTYAQLIGAKMVIIIDNVKESSQNIIMVNDGHGYQLNIPAVLIRQDDGIKIVNYLQSDDMSKQDVVLNMEFASQQFQHVNYTFWIKPNDRLSAKLVREFTPYQRKLGQTVTFQPRYGIWTCEQCRRQNFNQDQVPSYCISGGRYCTDDPDDSGLGTGRDILYEVIRQICINNVSQDKWWEYVAKIDEECVSNFNELEACSLQIMKILQINIDAVQQCVKQSYQLDQTGSVNPLRSENSLLFTERQNYLQNGVQFWPSVSVDNSMYRGNLLAQDIFEDICSGFKNPPQVCNSVLGIQDNPVDQNNDMSTGTLIFIIILLLSVIVVVMVIVYKRMIQTEMKQEMSSQVNSMVSQYIAFYETQEKSVDNSRIELMQR